MSKPGVGVLHDLEHVYLVGECDLEGLGVLEGACEAEGAIVTTGQY
jgi:hypothetical protein